LTYYKGMIHFVGRGGPTYFVIRKSSLVGIIQHTPPNIEHSSFIKQMLDAESGRLKRYMCFVKTVQPSRYAAWRRR